MAPPSFALIILCFLGTSTTRLSALKPSLQFESADVGQSVTLKCKCYIKDVLLCYWFKQSLGQKPKLLSTFFSQKVVANVQSEISDDPRFHMDVGRRKHDLTISDLRVSDSATYLCVASNLYSFEFVEGITVSVRGSGLTIQTSVRQSISGIIQTLDCTVHAGSCGGDHKVYWFKSSGDSYPGLIYTRGDRNDQRERTPEPDACFYNLPIQSWNDSHAGTYYCAVVACGHILFGNGSTLEFQGEANSTLVYFLGAALAFTSILVISLAYTVFKLNKRVQNTESGATFCPTLATNAALGDDGHSIHYATVREFKDKTSKRRTSTMAECVYTSVKW